MAGLSNLIANTETKATTLPSWMNTAQQNVVNQATASSGNVPQLQNTVAQGAINQLSSPQNPFTQAQTPLNTIASGAANPWIVDQSTGNVTPNINTPLGGLFQAQNQQLQQLAPNIMAQPTAAGINAGQFGSLRTDTAADKALADAQAQLFTAQNTAALNNQQTGVQAANVMGNVAKEYGATAGNLANLQQTSPFSAASSLGKVISGLNVPTTETSSKQISPLNQLIAAGGALQGGTAGLNAFLNQISPGASISSVYKSLFGGSDPFSTNISGAGQTTVPIDVSGGGYGNPVSGTGASGGAGAGQILGTDGNVYNDPTYGIGASNTGNQALNISNQIGGNNMSQSDINQSNLSNIYGI